MTRPKRFGPIWSVPMQVEIASFPRLIASWTTGVAKSTSQVVKMMCAPLARSCRAHDFARAGALFCVSHVSSRSLRPLTPFFAFSSRIRILAVASAGLSNGAIWPFAS